MKKFTAIGAALLGFTGVALGAFGAHGLKTVVSPPMLEIWKTAVSYQMYHTPVLLVLAWLPTDYAGRWFGVATLCLFAGVIIFSGTLYSLVWFDLPVLGMVTPLGGILLLAGWLAMLVAMFRYQRSGNN